jgi:hypothetical protein
MQAFIDYLAAQSRAPQVRIDMQLDSALAQLDKMMEGLARELQVEYYGPEIGVSEGRHVYRLVVRAHEWEIHNPTWSLKVCTALPHAGWRADWAVQGVARLRKALVVQALPAFFAGYAQAVAEAGKSETKAGQRLAELARAFAPA